MKRLARWLRSLSDYLDPASRPALHTPTSRGVPAISLS